MTGYNFIELHITRDEEVDGRRKNDSPHTIVPRKSLPRQLTLPPCSACGEVLQRRPTAVAVTE